MTLKEHLGAVARDMTAQEASQEDILLTQLYLIYCAKEGRLCESFREAGHDEPFRTLDRMVKGLTTDAATAFFNDERMKYLEVSLLQETFLELLNRGARTGRREVGQAFQPDELSRFACALAEYKEGQCVYNPYSGIASYAGLLRAGDSFYGEERDRLQWAIGTINMYMEESPSANYVLGKSLDETRLDRRFDLVISTPPAGQVLRQGTRTRTTYPEILMSKAGEILAEGGTMVVVCPAAILKDHFAKMLVDSGMLDMVVFLPRELHYSAPYRTAVVRLRKGRGAEEPVTLVDGVTFSAPGGRVNLLRSDDLLKAIEDKDPSYVISVSPSTLRENGYMIVPVYYVAPIRNKEQNLVPLRSLGRFISPSYASSEPTTAICIRNLSDDSRNLSVMPTPVTRQPINGAGRYFRKLETKALLISATQPLRMGTVNASPEKPVYIGPYIHVFVPDEEKVSDKYVAYVLSKSKEVDSGMSVFRLRSDDLESILVPYVPKAEQDSIVRKEMQSLYARANAKTSSADGDEMSIDVVFVGKPEFSPKNAQQLNVKKEFSLCTDAIDWLSGNRNTIDAVIAVQGGVIKFGGIHSLVKLQVPVYILSDDVDDLISEFDDIPELIDGRCFPTGSENDLYDALKKETEESRSPAGAVKAMYSKQLEAARTIDGMFPEKKMQFEEKLINCLLPENADKDWFEDLRLIRDECFKILIKKGMLPPEDPKNFTLGAEVDLLADRIYNTNKVYILLKPIISPDLGKLLKATKDLFNKPHHESEDDTPMNIKLATLHVVMELLCTMASMIEDGLFNPGKSITGYWGLGVPKYECESDQTGMVRLLKDKSTTSKPYYYMGNIHLDPDQCRKLGVCEGDTVSITISDAQIGPEKEPVFLDSEQIIFYTKFFKKL